MQKSQADTRRAIGILQNPNASFEGSRALEGLSQIHTESPNMESYPKGDHVRPSSFATRVSQTIVKDTDTLINPNMDSSLEGDHISVLTLAGRTSLSQNHPNNNVLSNFTSLGKSKDPSLPMINPSKDHNDVPSLNQVNEQPSVFTYVSSSPSLNECIHPSGWTLGGQKADFKESITIGILDLDRPGFTKDTI
nr:hypothetical protein [Tanacetum cinerariifolium]